MSPNRGRSDGWYTKVWNFVPETQLNCCMMLAQKSIKFWFNRPFATNDHMVQNPPCWRHVGGIIMSLPSSMADFVPCDRLLQKAYCSPETPWNLEIYFRLWMWRSTKTTKSPDGTLVYCSLFIVHYFGRSTELCDSCTDPVNIYLSCTVIIETVIVQEFRPTNLFSKSGTNCLDTQYKTVR